MILVAALVLAQTKPSMIDNSMAWLRDTWVQVQKQGEPVAEAAVKKYRTTFRAIPKKVHELSEKFKATYASMKLDERRALISELWRVRSSLNMMALLDPGLLQQLTGIDAKEIAAMEATVNSMWAQVHKK